MKGIFSLATSFVTLISAQELVVQDATAKTCTITSIAQVACVDPSNHNLIRYRYNPGDNAPATCFTAATNGWLKSSAPGVPECWILGYDVNGCSK